MDDSRSLFHVTDHEVVSDYSSLDDRYWTVIGSGIAMFDNGEWWNKYGSIQVSRMLFANSLDYN